MTIVHAQASTKAPHAARPPKATFAVTELKDAMQEPSGEYAILVDGVLLDEAGSGKIFTTRDRGFIDWVCEAFQTGKITYHYPTQG